MYLNVHRVDDAEVPRVEDLFVVQKLLLHLPLPQVCSLLYEGSLEQFVTVLFIVPA